MSWLLREGDVLAVVEERRKGWQAALQGAVILRGPAIVQTLTRPTRGGLDIAWCSPAALGGGRPGLRVRRITRVPARWVSPPHVRPGALVVARGGTFERWRLHIGDCLEVQ